MVISGIISFLIFLVVSIKIITTKTNWEGREIALSMLLIYNVTLMISAIICAILLLFYAYTALTAIIATFAGIAIGASLSAVILFFFYQFRPITPKRKKEKEKEKEEERILLVKAFVNKMGKAIEKEKEKDSAFILWLRATEKKKARKKKQKIKKKKERRKRRLKRKRKERKRRKK